MRLFAEVQLVICEPRRTCFPLLISEEGLETSTGGSGCLCGVWPISRRRRYCAASRGFRCSRSQPVSRLLAFGDATIAGCIVVGLPERVRRAAGAERRDDSVTAWLVDRE